MTPLVFVYGFMGGSEQWQDQTSLAETGHLIRVDLPGFGRNAQTDLVNRIEGFADIPIALRPPPTPLLTSAA